MSFSKFVFLFLFEISVTFTLIVKVKISNNIIDQLYFLQDVLNIQVDCVNTYLKDVLLKEFVIKYCYEQLIPQVNPPTV